MCLKAMKRADTRASIEGMRLDAPLPLDVKVAVATVAAPGDAVKLDAVLTAVSAVAKFAVLLLEATNVLI